MVRATRLSALSLSVFVAALLGARPAQATVMREVPFSELIAGSDAVILATVVASEVERVDRGLGPQPETRTTLAVREWLQPDAAAAGSATHAVVRELGGVTQDHAYRIDGIPTYAVGEEVVVFVVRHPEVAGEYRTYAMVQGRFTVRRGVPGVPSVVTRDLSGLSFAQWAQGRMHVREADSPAQVELGAFLEMIRGAR